MQVKLISKLSIIDGMGSPWLQSKGLSVALILLKFLLVRKQSGHFGMTQAWQKPWVSSGSPTTNAKSKPISATLAISLQAVNAFQDSVGE